MRRVASLLVLLSLVAACDTSNFAFKVDESIRIVEPKARAEVALPLAIRWTDDKPPADSRLDPTDPTASYYGVFVDDAPLGPGKRLESLLPDNTTCEGIPDCPTQAQLADVGAYLTAEPSVVIEFIADLRPTTRGNAKDTHEVTVVRMRGDKRVGEIAFRQTFFVSR